MNVHAFVLPPFRKTFRRLDSTGWLGKKFFPTKLPACSDLFFRDEGSPSSRSHFSSEILVGFCRVGKKILCAPPMVVCKIMLIRFIIWPLFITSFCVFNVLGTFFLRREREEFWKHEAVRWKPLFQSFSSRLRFSGSDCRKRILIGLGDKARDKRLMKANWFWDAWFY